MWLRDSGFQRGVELGPYPLEALAKKTTASKQKAESRLAAPHPGQPLNSEPLPESEASGEQSVRAHQGQSPLAQAARKYSNILQRCLSKPPAPRAPVPDDLARRTQEIKGAAYYLDASHVGVCKLDSDDAKASAQLSQHTHAIVIWVEYGPSIESSNLAHGWLKGAEHDIALMRALEIAVSITGHIRALGFNADCHAEYPTADECLVDLNALGIKAGLGLETSPTNGSSNSAITRTSPTKPVSLFFQDKYAAVAISTEYSLVCDQPLANQAKLNPIKYWLGMNGATSNREHRRRRKRASHLSRYPMEQVKRVERPTTLILDDEIPRVPKRAEFFQRARSGDLGRKAQEEVQRFAFKHPLTDGMMAPLRAMVPHQDGVTSNQAQSGFSDATANSLAVKSLSYHLGADLTGICEIPEYAWYSHGPDGKEIEMRHKYAVVMLIDQGYDTMEGASGDDWISGCQSMRGYIRGAEIAGIMADFFRANGYDSRPQTNADSHVLQIPLVLLAGLGELSRIGELVLNPFVGPRFKSVVLTTNLPLVADKPIDFGLQEFCGNCLKCARECPVNAIPFGEKVMFNGYEIWKPDVERCTRYRVTNPKGSACGRCMKTCPLNKTVNSDGALIHRIGSWLGIHARPLKKLLVPVAVYLDDRLGYGKRNPIKRWWLDLELIDGQAQIPKGTNERDLDPHADTSGKKSPVGYYHAQDMPAPNSQSPVLVNHKAAIERASLVESVAQAKHRRANNLPKPEHYIPTKQLD